MITPEEVNYAYRLYLGREPENEDVVVNYCQTTQTLEQLSRIFMSSPEFMRRMGNTFERPDVARHRHPFNLPAIPVETEASPEQLDLMFDRIHQEWTHLGKNEPYWSVLTQPQNYMAEFENHREQFYASGHSNCETLLSALRRSQINPSQFATCLEVGCGVGRVTGYLASTFSRVIAADISKEHIQIAQSHLASKGVSNIEFQHWQRVEQMTQLPQLDLIISVITLQHNPPPIMAWMLTLLLSRLRSGGVAYFQVPTYRSGYLFEVERYLASTPPDTLEMHFLPQPDIFRLLHQANCQCLEIREDGSLSDEDSMLSNTFLVQKRS